MTHWVLQACEVGCGRIAEAEPAILNGEPCYLCGPCKRETVAIVAALARGEDVTVGETHYGFAPGATLQIVVRDNVTKGDGK